MFLRASLLVSGGAVCLAAYGSPSPPAEKDLQNVKIDFFRLKNFNIFYDFKPPKFSLSQVRAPIYPSENRIYPSENPLSEREFSISEIEKPDFQGPKKEKTRWLRAFSSTQYKYTTFFGEKQIALTFRNNSRIVKKTRFASARGCHVLYYEAA